jgi:hypothetical protein
MKTAIFVRGNARTWNYLKKDNIEFTKLECKKEIIGLIKKKR